MHLIDTLTLLIDVYFNVKFDKNEFSDFSLVSINCSGAPCLVNVNTW